MTPNEVVIEEFRSNSGTVTRAMGGGLAGLELLLLHHSGRTSEKPYTTPLAYMTLEGDYLLLGSFAGSPVEPAWVRNVESMHSLTVEVGSTTRTMAPEVLRAGPERDRLYSAARRNWPFVDGYEKQTSRPFPVVRLSPID